MSLTGLAGISLVILSATNAAADQRQCDDYVRPQPEVERAFTRLELSLGFTQGLSPEFACRQDMGKTFALVQRSFQATGCEANSDIGDKASHWANLENSIRENDGESFSESLRSFRESPRTSEMQSLCSQLAALDPASVDVSSYESVNAFTVDRMNLSQDILRLARSAAEMDP